MRGIILAGGTGTRLAALTKVVNKHLLPVGGRPMIEWPIRVLRENNIDDITVVSTPRGVGQLAELLGSKYTYRVQDRPGGIAEAITCAGGNCHDRIAVILGDNVFLPSPYLAPTCSMIGIAHCYLTSMPKNRLSEFGVPTFKGGGVGAQIIDRIDEKPSQPASPYVVTGLYLFGPDVFDRIKSVRPGERGEVEVTDLLNWYAYNQTLNHTIVEGFWGDAGTPDGMLACSEEINRRKNT